MIRLHGYWRSGSSYRIRIALELKCQPYQQVTHDLRQGDQKRAEYLKLQPQGLVPALEVSGATLIQSPAIIEWLDEAFPAPRLLPQSSFDRAIVRGMAAVIGCDIHPLNNLRVLKALDGFAGGVEARSAWIAQWITEGFAALETMIARYGDGFCFGASPGLADVYLVPQVYSAERFGVDLSQFPHLRAAACAARSLAPFRRAAPECQPDADPD